MRTSNTVQRALPSLWKRLVHHPFTTVDVADVTLRRPSLLDSPSMFPFHQRYHGWSPLTTALNQRLAILARETGMAMATGSMIIAMEIS